MSAAEEVRKDEPGPEVHSVHDGIVEHDNFVKWMNESVRVALEKDKAS